MAAWPVAYDDAFVPLTAAILDQGLTLYVCTRTDEASNDNAEQWLQGRPGVQWLDCGVDTVWVRDWGPFFLEGEEGRQLGDSWYLGQRPNDNHYPTDLGGQHFDAPVHEVPMRLDGGNLLPVAEGACLSSTTVTSRSELDPSEAEATLRDALGCPDVVWLEPVPEEITGHVDMHVLPLPDGRVLSGLEVNDAVLWEAGLEPEPFPMPPAEDLDLDGWTDHATFLNAVWLGEGVLLVPTYQSWPERSEAALELLEELLPGVRVVGVPSEVLLLDGGAIHCVVKGVYETPPPPPRVAKVDPEPRSGCSSASPPGRGLAVLLLSLLLSTWRGRRPLPSRRC